LLYFASRNVKVYVRLSSETVGMSVASAGTTFWSLSKYNSPRFSECRIAMSVDVSATAGSSEWGSSLAR
jgi:hypothetical protein